MGPGGTPSHGSGLMPWPGLTFSDRAPSFAQWELPILLCLLPLSLGTTAGVLALLLQEGAGPGWGQV